MMRSTGKEVSVDERQWITVEEAARLLGVHDQTVRRWLRAGRLQGTLLSRRAGYRIQRAEIERVLREGLPEGDSLGELAA
jgi:excisionase family DNA binding protein